MRTYDFCFDWYISSAGLVLNFVTNGLLISVGSLVCYNWNFTGLNGDDWLVLNFINNVVSSVFRSEVSGLVLNSNVLVKDSVVSGLGLFSVE